MMKEYKFLVRYVEETTGEIVERIDYDHSLNNMVKHYDSTGLNVLSIKQI